MTDDRAACRKCGSLDNDKHGWVEGDCVLPHRTHSRATLGHVCARCVTKHRTWLAEIVELYATLNLVLLVGSVPDNTADHKRPKKAPEAPAPVRLEVLAMTADRDRLRRTGAWSDLPDTPAVLTDLALRYCDDNSLEGASLSGNASTAAVLLIEHAEALVRLPWVDEYDAELGWVRAKLRLAHGLSDLAAKPVGKCPSLDGNGHTCNGPLWPDTGGALAVECGRCHRHFDERFLRHLGGMIEAS